MSLTQLPTTMPVGRGVGDLGGRQAGEKFGERWTEVKAVLTALEYYGIHMLDVNPGNVALAD